MTELQSKVREQNQKILKEVEEEKKQLLICLNAPDKGITVVDPCALTKNDEDEASGTKDTMFLI